MDRSFQVEAIIGAGRGALIVGMFGAGWLGWGLGEARVFNGFVGPAFGFIELFSSLARYTSSERAACFASNIRRCLPQRGMPS